MDNQQPTCKDRIEKNLKGRIAEFEKALSLEGEDFWSWLDDSTLSFDDDPRYRAKKMHLSYGGPSDFFLFFTELDCIEYHYQDWYDGAKRELQGHDYEVMHQVYKRITE
jgi:hypothetical protein